MSLGKKIYRTCVIVVMLAVISVGGVTGFQLFSLRQLISNNNQEIVEYANAMTGVAVKEQIGENMCESAWEKAIEADSAFSQMASGTRVMADTLTQLYEHEAEYASRDIPLPDKEKAGELSVQFLHSVMVDPEEPEIAREAGLLGNVQDTLLSINANTPNVSSNYIATKSGLFIQADYIADTKFGEDGKVLPYEAYTRPWYQGAMETGDLFFSKATRDVHTGEVGIMCGVPFYRGDEFMGVAGTGMYLSHLEEIVLSARNGEKGCGFILNDDGQVLFSSAESGIFAVDADNPADVRTLAGGELRTILQDAVDGKDGWDGFEKNNEYYLISYAPLETVGWTFVIVLSESEAMASYEELVEMVGEITQEVVDETDGRIVWMIGFILIISVVLGVILLIVSGKLSKRISKPIRNLTEQVKKVDGDNLDFEWEYDTKDETGILANAFRDMTQKMKQYIMDITRITAEKERIGAELDVAARIQEDMLPKIFPAYPDRKEFDIYATMDPAKVVGGDFYDFFLIDEDHLGIVIADVSSKGVPAALFMVIAKTLIKNHTLYKADLDDVFFTVNNQLCEGNDEGMFVTAWMAVLTISTGELEYINAGHNLQLMSKDGSFEWIPADAGFVLAGLENIPYHSRRCSMQHGGRLFLYTDGLTEAQNAAGELYGEERLLASINRHIALPLQEMLRAVRADIDAFVGEAEQFDDMTMVVLEYR